MNTLDEGKTVCTAFLDLHKAFDSLDHSIILHHLSELGVPSGSIALKPPYNLLPSAFVCYLL